VLVRVEFSDVGYLDCPLYGGFVWAPFDIQIPVSDGGGVQSLRWLFQLNGIDDISEMLLVIFVVDLCTGEGM